MKSAVAALSLFMLGSYAAAVPEPTKVGGTTPTVVARAALATYSGVRRHSHALSNFPD